MGVTDILSRKSGVIVGEDIYNLFKHCQKHNFAIPAVNVTSSSTIIACLEAAKAAKSPIILQISQGGGAFFAGKSINNANQEASVAGAIAAAHFIRAVAPIYGVPVVLHTLDATKPLLQDPRRTSLLVTYDRSIRGRCHIQHRHNSEISQASAPMKQWLEMEIGITGESVDNNSLYTQPPDILNVHNELSKISQYFSIAAAFGNVQVFTCALSHDLSNLVKLKFFWLETWQRPSPPRAALQTPRKPVFFVFHGGSGSEVEEFKTAISYGVVKVNVDTDTQYAYLEGIRDYMLGKKDYVLAQVGNPEGQDKPNKKYYDPRVWVRECEKTMTKRVLRALEDFNAEGQL
ncbi:Fructose-bisphosphate aldolase 1 [Thelotrema lepadinum]|nr:Fructose-bisphosphate aldolase 1 [Thelotrema lepadinum]